MSKEKDVTNIAPDEIAEFDCSVTPLQMEIFTILDLPAKKQPYYSNTVDIYDALPKYVWEKRREHNDLKSATIVRQCTINQRPYIVKLKPALIDKGDRVVLIYPGQREELVEDALRKMAVNGNGGDIQDKAGVKFALYELRNELTRMGRTYSLSDRNGHSLPISAFHL